MRIEPWQRYYFEEQKTKPIAEIPRPPNGYSLTWLGPQDVGILYGAMTLTPRQKQARVRLFSSVGDRNTHSEPNSTYFKLKVPVMIKSNGTWVRLQPTGKAPKRK